MVEFDDHQPTYEDVQTFRQMVEAKYGLNSTTGESDKFHPKDLQRFNSNDKWVLDFLINNENNMKHAFKQFCDTVEWRKTFGVNEICEENVRSDYLINSNVFLHGRDLDGKRILMFDCRKHTRGCKKYDDLKRCLIYWVERGLREEKYDKLTVVFDMLDTGLGNVDMEYTRITINTLKLYYPNTLNWILIYEMPWIMNATLQIVKKLLPKKAVEVLKTVNSKNIRQYIGDDNMPVLWGGTDDYEYKFEPENRQNDEVVFNDGSLHHQTINNNNSVGHENLNLLSRKVHFANNLSESPSPMSELSTSSFETRHDMLQLSPAETIVFQKNSNNELTGNVHILNSSKKAVTYKVKTTAPDKYRVRPSSGTLSPMTSANINVVIQKGQQIQPVNKDKFLVMCMALPDGEPLTSDEIANMWKEVTANSPEVEQHRLKCTMPVNAITTAIINNADSLTDNFIEANMVTSNMSHNGTKQSVPASQQHLHATVNQLNETVNHLNQQIKSQQSLQWITIFVFIMISIAIVYILKMEIQNSNSQYCIDNEASETSKTTT